MKPILLAPPPMPPRGPDEWIEKGFPRTMQRSMKTILSLPAWLYFVALWSVAGPYPVIRWKEWRRGQSG